MKNLSLTIMLFALLFASCGDDTLEKSEYKDGVIVVNQGAFQTGTGTLTFKARGSSTPVQNVFSLSNDGAFLGNIAQSMIEHDGKNYISINNGGKIVVTDKDDFTIIDTIGGISQSRYFASNGDKLYVSTWGVLGWSGNVQQINADNNTIEDVVPIGNGPEGLLLLDGFLYIANSGGFMRDSILIIKETVTNISTKILNVGDNPEYMVKDNDDNIYLICNGHSDFFEPELSTPGRLVKVKDKEIEWSFELPNGSNRLAIDADNGFLYFNMDGNVVKQDINSETLAPKIIRQGTAFALGFDDVEDKLYVGDAKDFASQGEVFVYSTAGELVESFQCGIIPSYFHFK